MKTFKIAYLYYDLMNLYGEIGNVLALKSHLEQQNIQVNIDHISLNDEINIDDYDLFYIGSGNDEALLLSLERLRKYQKQIKKAFKNNKFFLITGNAINMFGKNYTTLDNITYKCLDILNYNSIEIDFRIVGEQKYNFSQINYPIIGFQNRGSVLKEVKENCLFNVINGTGNVPKATTEGIWQKNFYATHLLGPLLIRNPYFTEYIVKQITKYLKIDYKYYENEWEIKAYLEYQKNLLEKH